MELQPFAFSPSYMTLRVGGAHIWIFRKLRLKSAKTKHRDAGD